MDTTKSTHAVTDEQPRPTTLHEVRELAVIPIFSTSEPNFAGLLGLSRWAAYRTARKGGWPTLRNGSRVLISVQPLRRILGDLPETAAV